MGDAWIYLSGAATDDLVRLLAELGFSPRRVNPHGLAGSVDRSRPPVLAVIVAGEKYGAGALCAEVRSRDELGDVPLLLAVAPEHLPGVPDLDEADELLVPPFSVAELKVRVARARRMANHDAGGGDEHDVVTVGSLSLNESNYQVTVDGDPVGFTYTEYELLKFLMTHPRRAFSREALLARVWGYAHYGSGRTVDVHIRRLRAKIGPEHAARIRTVRNVGYLFDATQPLVPSAIAG